MKRESFLISMAKLITVVVLIVGIGTILGILVYSETIPKSEVVINNEIEKEEIEDEEIIEDETKNWQTYRNEEYGFELKYPEELFIDKKLRVADNYYCLSDGKKYKGISLKELIHRCNIGIYMDNDDSMSELEGLSDDIFKFEGRTYYVILSRTVHGTDVNKCKIIYNQILSTFKFIEKDETADWQTYQDEEYGFEIKYPEDYFFEQDTYALNEKYRKSWVQFADLEWKDQRVHNPSLIIDLIKTDLSIEEYLNKTGDEGSIMDGTCSKEATYCLVKNEKDIFVGGDEVSALQFSSAAVSGSDDHALVKNEEYIIDLRKHNSGIGSFPENVFNQILSTFKFIKKDETSDWKTYRNEDLGFELKYPSDFSIDKVLNDEYNRLVVLKNEKDNFEVRIRKGKNISLNQYYYLDFPVSSKSIIGGKEALVFEAPHGYCDGPECSNPFVAYSTKNDDDFYNLVFYGNAILSETEKSILSTFKFIEKDETADWKTYRNEEYGFEMKYPEYWNNIIVNENRDFLNEESAVTFLFENFPERSNSRFVGYSEGINIKIYSKNYSCGPDEYNCAIYNCEEGFEGETEHKRPADSGVSDYLIMFCKNVGNKEFLPAVIRYNYFIEENETNENIKNPITLQRINEFKTMVDSFKFIEK